MTRFTPNRRGTRWYLNLRHLDIHVERIKKHEWRVSYIPDYYIEWEQIKLFQFEYDYRGKLWQVQRRAVKKLINEAPGCITINDMLVLEPLVRPQ